MLSLSILKYVILMTIKIIQDTQKRWSDALLAISKAYASQEDYLSLARKHILNIYAFDEKMSGVLFKPTMAIDKPIRTDLEGTLSYFVGNNSHYPHDAGFALQNWKCVTFDNHAFYKRNDLLFVSGQYLFTTYEMHTTQADYTFGFTYCDKVWKIMLQHSSLTLPKK